MRTLWKKLSMLLILVLLVSACSLPGAPAETQIPVEAIYTAAAQTLQAQLTESAANQTPTDTPAPATETLAPAELLPTDTPTPEFTATMAFTPTPQVPIAVVSVNSNCRKGPSPDYDPPITVLRTGDRAEIFGRNNNRTWWYVQIPGRAGQFCWIWGNNVNVEGDTGGVQYVEPPPLPPTATPTPTPNANFDPSFDNVHNCGGDPHAIFELDNIGGVAFESMRLEIEDRDADDEIYDASHNAPFMGASNECPPGGDKFPVGKTFWVGGNIEDGGSGNDARATITLCTRDDLKGTCVTKTVDFDIP